MKIRVGQIGVGTVGSGVVELLTLNRERFQKEMGLELELYTLCSNMPEHLEAYGNHALKTTQDASEVLSDPNVDIVVEVAGGYDLPRKWIRTALENGKHVVTANKAMLAKYGSELFPLAHEKGCCLQFEAAVGGGIPIIRSLQEGLVADTITGLACIINGTCNYILTEMEEKKSPFDAVLREAQHKGYAEADPTFDVDGIDSAHKVAILASIIDSCYVDFEEMLIEGIRSITPLDIAMADELGYVIKLLGVVRKPEGGKLSASVYPALLEKEHLLANVNGVTNAVYLKASSVGPVLLTGAGAGKLPTASAIVGDIVSIARRIQSAGKSGLQPLPMDFIRPERKVTLEPIEELETAFYLRLMALDKPGVLGKVTTILGEEGVSIRAITQKPEHDPDSTPIIILTHVCKNAQVSRALERIARLGVLNQDAQILRFYE